MTLDDLDALMTARFSCRAYRPDPVPRETIEAIVDTARRVPSWCNAQPWKLTITSGEETAAFRTALRQQAMSGAHDPDLAFPASYPGVYGDRRRTCGWQLYDAVGVTKGDREASNRQAMRNFDLFDAPHSRHRLLSGRGWGLTVRSIAAASSPPSAWRRRPRASPPCRRRRWPVSRPSCTAISAFPKTG